MKAKIIVEKETGLTSGERRFRVVSKFNHKVKFLYDRVPLHTNLNQILNQAKKSLQVQLKIDKHLEAIKSMMSKR